MFEGSEHHDKGYFHPLQEAGGTLNGSTNADRTNYWEVVPTNALELALWMESDRMGYLLPALTEQKFQNQRDVVLNERRQNYENRPYGFAGMAMVAALYPPDHPYHWLTIGEAADLRAAELGDVRAFFQTYYRPRNASLALAGDIDTDDALRAGRALLRIDRAGRAAAAGRGGARRRRPAREVRLLLEDRVELPRLYLAWHSAGLFADGDAEMDLVAELLAGSKTSRLYRALVYDQRIATEIAASQNSREMGGFFQVVATAAPGRTLQELDAAITREIDAVHRRRSDRRRNGALPGPGRVALHLPPADGRRLRRQVRSAERLQRLPRRSRLLRHRISIATGRRPPPALQAEAARSLRPHRRMTLSVVPRGRVDLALEGSVPVSVS